ncbi:MAG: tetratricopeptide repeat protein [Thermodesulfobacteriota bacterium]|nr:tetratricopeptide repeat protein [Thermodesulfobacteriota bacterium]
MDPGFTKGYRGVVKSYTALGDPQGAVIYMESLFLENPERAEVLYGLGYALYNTEKYKEAKIYFEKAVGLNPDLAAAWNNIAVIYHFVFPDYKKAREYYEKAIEISKKTKDDWVLKIAEENLAYIPKEADALKPIKENLTLEEFIDNFISMIEESDEGGIRRLVVRHKKNCEEALDLFLKDAMLACVEGRKEDEKKRLLFLKILEREYRVSFNSPFLKNKLDAYNKLNEDEKKKIVMGEKLLEEGLKKEEKGLYLDARNNYQKAISHFFEIKDKNRTGTAFLYLGDIYRKMKKYSLANEAYSNALRYFIEIMEKEKEALALSSLGITNFFLNEFSTSLEYFKRSLKTYKFLNDEESVKAVERNIKLIKAKINKAKKGE